MHKFLSNEKTSLNDMAQGLNNYLAKNRESLSMEELILFEKILNFIELSKANCPKAELKEEIIQIIQIALKFCLNNEIIDLIKAFF